MHSTIHPAKRAFDVMVVLLLVPIASVFTVGVLFAMIIEHGLRGRLRDPLFYAETRMSAGSPFSF
jgi:hypothetical protein